MLIVSRSSFDQGSILILNILVRGIFNCVSNKIGCCIDFALPPSFFEPEKNSVHTINQAQSKIY